jgi:hypothetical protein
VADLGTEALMNAEALETFLRAQLKDFYDIPDR